MMNTQRTRCQNLNGGSGNKISLGAALEAGRRAATPLSKEDHSISLASGYTEDPTEREPTERSTERSFNMSSSLRLSETGELMVTTTPRASRKTPLPPPPFSEGDAEVQEMPKKATSFRRRSVFGSTTPMSVSDHPTSVSSSSVSPKPPRSERRRSFLGSGNASHDFHDSISSEFSLHNITDHSKAEDSTTQKPLSMHSMSSASLDLGSSFGNLSATELTRDEKKKKKIRVKKFIKKIKGKGSSKKQHVDDGLDSNTKKSEDTLAMESNEFDAAGEDQESEESKKPPGRARRHSLFGSAGSEKKDETTEDAKPPMIPKPTTRRRRRSLFGSAGSDKESSYGRSSVQEASPSAPFRAKSPGRLRRMLGSGIETETAALQPASPQRSNNPYKLVNAERGARDMQPFIRSMLLDSLAKDVAEQLSRSDGKKCRSTDYFGNVGKGIDVWTIHQKMMALEGTEKANIVSEKFYLFGIGMAKGNDDQIYMCELFN